MTVSAAEVNSILAYFDLPPCVSFERMGGWANQNLLALLPGADAWVIKILESQRVEMLVNDLAIQAQLQAVGMGTPRYIANHQGSILYSAGGLKAVVSRRLAGIHCETLDAPFCGATGAALARFHAAVQHLPIKHKGWLNAETAQAALRLRSDAPWVAAAQRLIAANLALFTHGLPAGIIHGDFHENNVLVESETAPRIIAVMDFEEAEENLLLVDIACTLLSLCRDSTGTRLEPGKLHSVLSGYLSVRSLTAGERRWLPDAIRYVIRRRSHLAAPARHVR